MNDMIKSVLCAAVVAMLWLPSLSAAAGEAATRRSAKDAAAPSIMGTPVILETADEEAIQIIPFVARRKMRVQIKWIEREGSETKLVPCSVLGAVGPFSMEAAPRIAVECRSDGDTPTYLVAILNNNEIEWSRIAGNVAGTKSIAAWGVVDLTGDGQGELILISHDKEGGEAAETVDVISFVDGKFTSLQTALPPSAEEIRLSVEIRPVSAGGYSVKFPMLRMNGRFTIYMWNPESRSIQRVDLKTAQKLQQP